MIIKPMIRSNICINAHPVGCARETERQIAYVRSQKAKRGIKTAAEGPQDRAGPGLFHRLRPGIPDCGCI